MKCNLEKAGHEGSSLFKALLRHQKLQILPSHLHAYPQPLNPKSQDTISNNFDHVHPEQCSKRCMHNQSLTCCCLHLLCMAFVTCETQTRGLAACLSLMQLLVMDVGDDLQVDMLSAGHRMACYPSPPQDGSSSSSESDVDTGCTKKAPFAGQSTSMESISSIGCMMSMTLPYGQQL